MQLKHVLLLLLFCTLIALPVLGQGQQRGRLQGTVTGPGGAQLPGVTITITSPALQGSRTSITGGNGSYVFHDLLKGDYKVTFQIDGMATVERTASVEIGLPSRVDADMRVADVTETIVVTGETANQLETTEIGGSYDYDQVDALAVTRDLDGISLLSPGVTANTPLVGQVTISGGFAYDNLFMVDGVDVNSNVFGDPDNLFIEDAIEETQVLVSTISAEYGRFTGGVVNAVTKNGGNAFHGSFRVDLTNPSWRDETPLEEDRGTEREDIVNDTYSATLGGYLVQDKLWFFLAARDVELNNQITLQQTGIPFNNVQDDQRFEVKLTGNIATSHTIQVVYTDATSSQIQPASVAEGATLDTIISPDFPNTLGVARYSGILTSRLFLEAQYSEKKFAFENFGGTSTDIFDSPFRCWNIAGCQYNAPLFDANDPEDRNNEQLAGSLSWFLDSGNSGAHDLKFGVEEFTSIRTGGNSNSATDWVLFHDFKLDAAGLPILDANGKATPVFNSFFESPDFGLGVFFESFRGSEVSIETTALYVNDSWQLNDHWSFNLGVRAEDVTSASTQGIEPVTTDGIVPRLAATYDVKGDGKYRFDGSYAEYIGGYNMSLFTTVTNTGNASYVYGPYIGPEGEGIDFAPGFDPDNYFLLAGNIPTLNVFHDADLSAPTVEEWSMSFGLQLPRGGYFKATYQDRQFTGLVEDFTEFALGASTGEIQGVEITLPNKEFRNTDLSYRTYKALLLQGSYRVLDNFTLAGNYTHQFENDGNYEGEGGQGIGPAIVGVGDYVEFTDERNHPGGHLPQYQADKFRIWGIYDIDLGRAGSLGLSGTFSYFSALTNSLSANLRVTPEQVALDPGYASIPTSMNTFFGQRGSTEVNDWNRFDFVTYYNIGLWRNLDAYLKAEVRNVFNSQTQVDGDDTVFGDGNGPVDSLGRPLNFTQGDSFGNARSNTDFQLPREYRFSVGFRF